MPTRLSRSVTRRDFLKMSALTVGAAAGFPTIIPSSVLGANAPSKRITMGCIGTGNQGTNDLRGFLQDERVQIIAVCDLNRESTGYWNDAVGGREPAKRIIEEHYAKQKESGDYKGCTAYEDFRELLAGDDIDTVQIAIPDHWHAIPVIAAAKAA